MMRKRHTLSRCLTPVLAFALAAGVTACGDDTDDLPVADHVIRVTESNFNPSNPAGVHVGERIEWQNTFSQARTVISGTGPDDPDRGDLFDVTLPGYKAGDAIGGRFQIVVTEPDTIHYFNTILPDGFVGPFRGQIIVQP
jgi:hypothetical protein